jgi:hypothetical protein
MPPPRRTRPVRRTAVPFRARTPEDIVDAGAAVAAGDAARRDLHASSGRRRRGAAARPLPVQRHLFEIPDEVAYFNCAAMAPLLEAARRAGEGALLRRAHYHPAAPYRLP